MITLAFGIGLWLILRGRDVGDMSGAIFLWLTAMVCDVLCVYMIVGVL